MNPKRMVIALLLMISFAFLFPFSMGLAQEEEIMIKSLPEKVAFSIKEMAPGKSKSKTITIQNVGKQSFNYLSSIKLKSGSEKLFNELLVEISAENKLLYSGQLTDFKKLDSRYLAESKSEELTFKVKIPATLGNEFQGLGCELEFAFYAQGILDGVLPTTGLGLPDTGTNMFNYLVAGTALLLFGVILQVYFLKRRKWYY